MARPPVPLRPARTLSELAARIVARQGEEAVQRAANALDGIEPPPEHVFRYALGPEERQHAAGGNGGPPLVEPVALKPGSALVLGIGQHLYGDRHTTDLARACGQDPRVVRRWAAGEGSGPGPAATFFLRREVERRIAKLTEALAALDEFREERGWSTAAAPPPPPPAEPEVEVAAGIQGGDAAFWLNGLTVATGGVPTPLRAILSVRMNPRARVWSATVTIFDGSEWTLECDRGDVRKETGVRFAFGPRPERRELRILWDEEAQVWERQPDILNGPPLYVPPPRAEDDPAFVPQPYNPDRPRGALRSPRRAEAAREPQGKLI